MGWRNLFSSCAVVSVFVLAGNRFWFYILPMYLEYHTVVVLCYFFLFWREMVFGVMYVLSVQYSCAVVSVFCCGRKVNFVRIPYSHNRFSKILGIFFVKKMIPYKTYLREDQLFLALYGSTIIQS